MFALNLVNIANYFALSEIGFSHSFALIHAEQSFAI